MDNFEVNKILAAILVSVMIVTIVRLAADAIYDAGPVTSLPGPDVAPAASQTTAKAQPEVPLGTLMKKATIKRGKQISKKCVACHNFDKGGPNRIGPHIWNVINRKKAAISNFNYSAAMRKKGGRWTYKDLNAFLHKPRKYIPGTLMSFAGLRKPKDRAALLLYLRSLSDKPAKLP